jgi:hypothetical protein
MTKLCPRGKAAAKRKFKVYPSAYANAYASKICAGKIKDPSGVKRKDFRGSKAEGGLMEATKKLKRQGFQAGEMVRPGMKKIRDKIKKLTDELDAQKRDRAKVKNTPNKSSKKSGSSILDVFKSYGKYDGKPIELKSGGRACKLAMKGKGRAYGKNS